MNLPILGNQPALRGRELLVETLDRMICYLLMMEVVILPWEKRWFLHSMGIGLLALCWIGKMVAARKWIWQRVPSDIPILFFVVWGFLSSILSSHPGYSLSEFWEEMITCFFFFYLVVANIRDMEKIKMILYALIVSSLFMSMYGIYEFLSSGGSWTTRAIRISSLTSDYNYASTYFVLVIPVILYVIVINLRKTWRFYSLCLLLILNLLALYFTFTRAAWLGLFASVIVFSLMLNRKAMWPSFICTVFLGLLLFATPQGMAFYKNMGGIDGNRMTAWEFGIHKIVEHPLFGIGYGRRNMQLTFPNEEMYAMGLIHLHNTFLETTLEMGIPGGIFLAAIIGSLIVGFAKGYRHANNHNDTWLMIILLMVVSGYFIRNLFDHLYVDAPAVLFWLLMGIGASRAQQIRAANH